MDVSEGKFLFVHCVVRGMVGIRKGTCLIDLESIESIGTIWKRDCQMFMKVIPVRRVSPSVKDKVHVVMPPFAIGRTPVKPFEVEFQDCVCNWIGLEVNGVKNGFDRVAFFLEDKTHVDGFV